MSFSKLVFEVASADLATMGMTVISYTIKDLSDAEGYLVALGQSRTAEVHRDARIGEADAKMQAGIKVCNLSEMIRMNVYLRPAHFVC